MEHVDEDFPIIHTSPIPELCVCICDVARVNGSLLSLHLPFCKGGFTVVSLPEIGSGLDTVTRVMSSQDSSVFDCHFPGMWESSDNTLPPGQLAGPQLSL